MKKQALCLASADVALPLLSNAGIDWADAVWIAVPNAPVATGKVAEGSMAASGTSWFVRELANEGEVKSAKWTTAGLGVYEVFVNGQRVGARHASGRDGGEGIPGGRLRGGGEMRITFDAPRIRLTGRRE